MAHYYSKDGVMYDCGLRQARKDQLFASVTTQQKIEASPSLEVWKQNELLKLTLSHPPSDGEDADNYIRRIKEEHWNSSKGTMELGTRIHDAIHTCLEKNVGVECVDDDLVPFVTPAVNYCREKEFIIKELEKPLVNIKDAYAGMADCIAETPCGLKFILDWKSKRTKPGDKIRPYNEQKEQISAYAVAYWGIDALLAGKVYGVNAYISTTEIIDGTARFERCVYEPKELLESYEKFQTVCKLWRLRNNYDPRPRG